MIDLEPQTIDLEPRAIGLESQTIDLEPRAIGLESQTIDLERLQTTSASCYRGIEGRESPRVWGGNVTKLRQSDRISRANASECLSRTRGLPT